MGGCGPSLHIENSCPLKKNLLAAVLADWQVSSYLQLLPCLSESGERWEGRIPSPAGRFLHAAMRMALPVQCAEPEQQMAVHICFAGEEVVCFLGML